MPPLVSICLPNLNTRPFLAPRMESLLAQTLGDWELILSDNFSDDGSWEFLRSFKGDPRIRMFQSPRAGMYANWNACLREARGEFVYMATSDDTAEPGLLEALAAPLRGGRGVDVAVCDFQVIDEAGAAVESDMPPWPRRFYGEWMNRPHRRDGKTEFLLYAALGGIWITMTAVLFRRALLERIGMFRTDRGSTADHEWHLRACLATDIAFVPGRLATWRQREGQATRVTGNSRRLRATLEAMRTVLDDPRAGVPDAWRRVPGWREKLLGPSRELYENGYRLYRARIREEPRAFLRDAALALRQDPALLLRRAAQAFRWHPGMSGDPIARAQDLIGTFGGTWPPVGA